MSSKISVLAGITGALVLSLGSVAAVAESLEVADSSPSIAIWVDNQGCSSITDSDRAQIALLSHVQVPARSRVVPVLLKSSAHGAPVLAYIVPATCQFFGSRHSMQHPGEALMGYPVTTVAALERYSGISDSCVSGWACADAASLAFEDGAPSSFTTWLRGFDAKVGVSKLFRDPGMRYAPEFIAAFLFLMLALGIHYGYVARLFRR